MTKPANKALSLAVQYACNNAGLPSRPQLRRWVRAAVDWQAVATAEITIRFVDAEEGRALNREYRGKDYATNILSFPYTAPPELTGDLVLCQPVVLTEAKTQGKTPLDHFAHLIVHGMLHLQGHDHEADADAQRMEDQERSILAGFRIADPYQAEHS